MLSRHHRELILAAANRRLAELMNEQSRFASTGQRKFALETQREHVKPLREAITAFRKEPVA